MFRSSLSRFAVLGSLISFVCTAAAVFAEDFPVGSKVDASPYSNTWSSATITGTVQGGYTVKMDAANGFKKDEEYVVPAYRVRGSSAGGGTANGAGGSTAGSAGSNTASAGSTTGSGAPFGAVGNESFTVGTKIDASPYTDKWSSATITGRVPGGYVVKMDAGNGWKQNEEFVVPYSRARNLTSHAGAAVAANAPGGLGANAGGVNAGGGTKAGTANGGSVTRLTTGGVGDRVHPANPNIKWTTNYTPPGKTGPLNSGKGKPPDGVYSAVMWTAGMMINIGKLEIQGNTYRGFNANGGFHTFTVDGNGNMSLSAGLSGMPPGFTMKTVGWVGSDSIGRPLIKVTYIGQSGAHDTIDAIKQ